MLAYAFLLTLFFLSGFAAILYEVLWLHDLQLLLGSTAYSAATVLAVFFLGQALGSYAWGRRSAALRRPLLTYAFLELGIAASVGICLAAAPLWFAWYAPWYARLEHSPSQLLMVKLCLSVVVLLVPCFFMGGTLPVMGQHLVRRSDRLGLTGSALYAINTCGAVLGALATGFVLPPLVGYRAVYATAIAVNLLIAVAAAFLAMRSAPPARANDRLASANAGPTASRPEDVSPGMLRGLAFASGLLALAMEVLWTRMFAQVLENSVYAFSAILVVFLSALAGGSFLAHALCRFKLPPARVLATLLALSGMAVGASPHVLCALAPRLQTVAASGGWAQYLGAVFLHVTATVFVPGLLLGSVFPYLLRLAQPWQCGPGRILGDLTAMNTAGAILGSLVTGFFLIGSLGQYGSATLLALIYLALSGVLILTALGWRTVALASLVGAVALVVVLARFRLPVVQVDGDETVLQVWEGADATVAATQDLAGHRNIHVNNVYLVGGSAYATGARALAQIPLLLHPAPRKVFFIGMGTGITAGGALDFPVAEVVVSEYVPEVVAAARVYFQPYLNGLLDDPRVRIVCEDGRNYLRCKPDRYDVIIGDLFYPEQASRLFAKEHFEVVATRLNPEGIFAQWIPLYQLTEGDLGIIVRTMLEVFPQVTLWRGDTVADYPVVALVASARPQPLEPRSLARNLDRLKRAIKPADSWEGVPYLYYAGNLRQAEALFDGYPVNSDDKPVIEYLAPVHAKTRVADGEPWFTSLSLVRFYDALFQRAPVEQDPVLRQIGLRHRGHVLGGLSLYKSIVVDELGDERSAARWRKDYLSRFGRRGAGQPAGREQLPVFVPRALDFPAGKE